LHSPWKTYSPEKLGKLWALWRKAFRTADGDTAAMIELGRQRCEIIGPDPDTTAWARVIHVLQDRELATG
jgi:hypothetical protein